MRDKVAVQWTPHWPERPDLEDLLREFQERVNGGPPVIGSAEPALSWIRMRLHQLAGLLANDLQRQRLTVVCSAQDDASSEAGRTAALARAVRAAEQRAARYAERLERVEEERRREKLVLDAYRKNLAAVEGGEVRAELAAIRAGERRGQVSSFCTSDGAVYSVVLVPLGWPVGQRVWVRKADAP